MKRSVFIYLTGFLSCGLVLALVAATHSPTKAVSDRDVYYPASEDLAPDEMRIVALGTGMPSVRPKQAAACWLAELGNGDKFLFDIGSGCHERLAAQKIPYDYLNKVFIGHLHVDPHGRPAQPVARRHGDEPPRPPCASGGQAAGRRSSAPRRSMELMKKMYAWDIGTRSGVIDFRGGALEVHEFPFNGVNEVIYNENGVVIRSIPAVHGLDGSREFHPGVERVEVRLRQRHDPEQVVHRARQGCGHRHPRVLPAPDAPRHEAGLLPPGSLDGRNSGTHRSGAIRQGDVLVKPRLAIGYHFYNDFDTEPEVRKRVRKTYDGPLDLALDYMVWNVTKNDIRVRMSAVDEEIWPSPALKKKIAPDTGSAIAFSDFTISGAMGFPEVVGPIFDEINEMYGTDVEPIFKK